MSQKVEKPTLQGQRIKTRKRVLQGLQEAGDDLEAVGRFLVSAGDRLDYKRYAEPLFDILIVGGLLAPGGSILDGNEPSKVTQSCIFGMQVGPRLILFAQLFTRLIRRYKYLERMFEEEMKKVLAFLKGFQEENRPKLAQALACWLSQGTVPVAALTHLLQEHLVKDGVALEFLLEVLKCWKALEPSGGLRTALKKASLDGRLLDFFPFSKRSAENFQTVLREHNLSEVAELQRAQANAEVRRDLQRELESLVAEDQPVPVMVETIKGRQAQYGLDDKDVVVLLWAAAMGSVEWNKKEELVADQAVRHLQQLAPLFAAFCVTDRAEMALLLRVQEFCYDNMNFLKVFHKIVMLFYKKDVLSEDCILRWYRTAHLPKGKSVFLEQMSRFVDWLQYAEEESDGEV